MVFVRQARVVLEVGPETDPEVAERLARRLRAELRELDVDAVAFEPGETAPAGAKGPDAVTVGALVVAFSASGGVFTAVIGTLRAWLERQAERRRILGDARRRQHRAGARLRRRAARADRGVRVAARGRVTWAAGWRCWSPPTTTPTTGCGG